MATATYDVLLRPFREVVKLGQLGQGRAQLDAHHHNNIALRTAARALGNEGERALKKITPLLLNPTTEFGEFLLNLALHQDDVTPRFREIDALLYDFDDYVDLDTFEKAKFDALQDAVKSVAIVLLDKIRRHAAESSLNDQTPLVKFGAPPKLPHGSNGEVYTSSQATRRAPSRGRLAAVQSPQKPLPEPPRRGSGPYEGQPRGDGSITNESTVHHNSRPLESSVSTKSTSPSERSWYNGEAMQQPTANNYQVRPQASNSELLRIGIDQLSIKTENGTRQRPFSPDSLQSAHPSVASSTFSPVQYRSSGTISIPENEATNEHEEWSPVPGKHGQYGYSSSVNSFGQYSERAVEQSHYSASSHYGRSRQDSLNGRTTRQTSIDERNLVTSHEPISPISDAVNPFNESPLSRVSSMRTSISSGTKMESHGRVSVTSSTKARAASSGSLGPESSLGLYKGFCRGAKKFLTDGPGAAVKKVGSQAASSTHSASTKDYTPEFHSMFTTPIGFTDPMAQCSHCEYKVVYSQLLQDMQQDPLSNLQSNGLRYRIRFLFKSHVATRDLEGVYFACLFCSRAGATCRESDATVFQSVNLLLAHIARHPLPLPDVPGVTVLYDDVAPTYPHAQDYDLHIPNPSANLEAASALEHEESQIAPGQSLPSARGSKDHIQRRNEKPLARPGPVDPVLNALPVLQFLAGARITHVDFPERWEGKWCRGWHDGVYGIFPSKLAELEPPQELDLNNLLASGRSAVSKWKWEPKMNAASLWLKLGKNERINSIIWDDPNAWYWIGKNNQGKIGVFPKSHMKMESVTDGLQSEHAVRSGPKPSGFSSFFGRKG